MTDRDAPLMRRALRLAARGWGRTAPNPMVGAVVCAAGEIVGEGFHPRAGEPHAEIFALRQADERARGATLFVTLEPCAHHGRTPPCVEAIRGAGITRVVAAMSDPFPQVSGRGFDALRSAGIEVCVGVLDAQARELNRAYLKVMSTGLPWVTLKLAMTLDGKIATRTGDSRWVTGEAARRYVHRLRDRHDAVLIGSGTALADSPQLTVRLRGGRNPLRVVADSRARLPLDSPLAETGAASTVVWTARTADTASLEARGVAMERLPATEAGLDLAEGLRRLVARGVHSVLCEGGASLAGSLLDAGLVDEIAWFIAPILVGGTEAQGPVGGRGVAGMAEALELRQARVRRFDRDVGVFGYLTPLDPEGADRNASHAR